MQTKVTLASHSSYPLETIWYLWQASRSEKEIPAPNILASMRTTDTNLNEDIKKIFSMIVTSNFPVAENIWFVFLLENVSVSFREQMVRHRIGMKFGERLGVDIIPDLPSSTWWSQTSRVRDMKNFANEEAYRIPEKIQENEAGIVMYKNLMQNIQRTYNDLVTLGIPIEEAREVLPLATQHRISWGLNLSSIIHVVKTRSCWIAQYSLWNAVVNGMVEELAKVDPLFRLVANPPCIQDNTYKRCPYALDNNKRKNGEDPLPVCSLYNNLELKDKEPDRIDYTELKEKYGKLWGRNPLTAELIAK
jgi:thymidylate synthase (FAD)